ncbi:tetratricopeptide repeat-containing sensor histidine kinase [Ferruginibacter sp.]
MQLFYRFIFLCSCCFILDANYAFSQTIKNLDSLKNILKREKTDTTSLNSYLQKLKDLQNEDIAAKEIIADWIINNSTQKDKENLLIQTLQTQARNYLETGDYTKAAEFYNKTLAIGNEDSYYEIKCDALLGIGNVFYHTEQFNKEREYTTKSFLLSQKHHYKKGIGNAKLSIASDLLDDDTQIGEDTFNLLFKTMNECLTIWNELKDTSRIIHTYIKKGEYYAEYNYFDSALQSMLIAQSYFTKFDYKAISNYYFFLGKIYYQKGKANKNNNSDFNEAIKYFNECLPRAKKIKNRKLEAWCYDWLSVCYKNLGDYKLSYEYLEKHSYLYGSIVAEDNFKELSKVEHKYEIERKEKEIISLNATNQQKSTLNKILIGSAAALLLIGLLGYRNFRSRQKIQQQKITELEKDKQLLAIDAMLKGQEEERSRIAKDLHDGLGGMLSGVKLSFVNMKENMVMDAESVHSFENSIMQLDNTIRELRKVAHNLMPEALVRFGLKNAVLDFRNSMQVSSKTKIIFEQMGTERQLSNTADLYIYRIIQELINNAVKHSACNQILVQLTKTTDKILLTVEDDGKGFNTQQLQHAEGIGMKNIQQRVNYFKGKMDITSQPAEGTSVNIELTA